MRAFLTRGDGLDALQQVELPMPSPGPREVLVRIVAAGLNFRDLLVVKGASGWKPTGPRIPVSDGVGLVVAAGADVTRFRVGDRVAGIFLPKWLDGELTSETYVSPLGGAVADGVLAEYRVFDEQCVVGVPGQLTDIEAATLPVAGVTAWHAVRCRSRVSHGDSVLVQGTGGVSLFALQFVLGLGGRAIVLSSSDEKLARVQQLGAIGTINYSRIPEWEHEVLAKTCGRGVDHVIEVVGGENLNRSLRAVRVGGTISFIGLLAGLAAPIETYQFVTRNVRLHGIETGSRAMFESMNRFVEEQAVRPIIDSVYPFEEFAEALRRVESGRHFGKVVVLLSPSATT
jgi:NADPH:quinone reductase-like Zn-dependent oxidoreductase